MRADVFVESMLQRRGMLQDSVFSFCSSALRICRFTLLPSLVFHAFADHLVKAGRVLFDRTMPVLSSSELELRERLGEVFINQAIGIEDVLQAMLEQETDLGVTFTGGYETKLMQVCSFPLHIHTDPLFEKRLPDPHSLGHICYHGKDTILYRLYHMHSTSTDFPSPGYRSPR